MTNSGQAFQQDKEPVKRMEICCVLYECTAQNSVLLLSVFVKLGCALHGKNQ